MNIQSLFEKPSNTLIRDLLHNQLITALNSSNLFSKNIVTSRAENSIKQYLKDKDYNDLLSLYTLLDIPLNLQTNGQLKLYLPITDIILDSILKNKCFNDISLSVSKYFTNEFNYFKDTITMDLSHNLILSKNQLLYLNHIKSTYSLTYSDMLDCFIYKYNVPQFFSDSDLLKTFASFLISFEVWSNLSYEDQNSFMQLIIDSININTND